MATKKDAGPRFVAEVLVRGLVEVAIGGKNLDEARESAKSIKLDDVFPAQGELIDGTLEVYGITDHSAWDKIGQ